MSVLLPVYNGLPWLPVAVESVLTQTFSDFELLLVDDGSTDGSSITCDELAERDGRVRVLRHDESANRGVTASLNLGLAEARASYVARLDADDMMYPERLAKQVAHLDANPAVALIGSQVDWAGPSGTTRWSVPTDAHLARWTLLIENCFMGGGVMFRRDAVRMLGGYDLAFNVAEDYDLWARLSQYHEVENLPETLSWYNNLRTENLTHVNAENMDALALVVSIRSIRRYAPDADMAALDDLTQVIRWRGLPMREGGDSPARRVSVAVGVLLGVRRAFFERHNPTREAARAIDSDLRGRLKLLRWALIEPGGLGNLGRLHRPWDTRGFMLRVPAWLSRS